jgi:predicted metal-binding membrane protein
VSFLTVSTLLFAICAAVTIAWGISMSSMGGMPMPGGWTMSMAWMRMPGQSWAVMATTFLGMWAVMMTAMMLPSLVPMLRHYREAVASAEGQRAGSRLGWLTTLVGTAYFLVWILIGIAVFAIGIGLAQVEMQQTAVSRAVPIAAAVVVLLAGAFQFTAWKARHLSCCRVPTAQPVSPRVDSAAALAHGVRLGIHCSACCGNLILILLVAGIMDVRAMAVVTAAITGERLAPAARPVVRAIGAVLCAAGLVLLTRAAGLG